MGPAVLLAQSGREPSLEGGGNGGDPIGDDQRAFFHLHQIGP